MLYMFACDLQRTNSQVRRPLWDSGGHDVAPHPVPFESRHRRGPHMALLVELRLVVLGVRLRTGKDMVITTHPHWLQEGAKLRRLVHWGCLQPWNDYAGQVSDLEVAISRKPGKGDSSHLAASLLEYLSSTSLQKYLTLQCSAGNRETLLGPAL
ncbi:uncharacterized protein EI97DRAFT_49677 [Westerdykella ornata]|uniref:Uncharacterized protein n=1 Tax=Westerdykella ornata TaxID=318751 RepID=A0A6A6JJF0_WESOR|nr:uncharacterized protein EI97DRAFT_49677 [Westerdykella ornata]KAF2276118.1 hypothetical protein EI97DRAFT_49677 [Westerdykella ornata]